MPGEGHRWYRAYLLTRNRAVADKYGIMYRPDLVYISTQLSITRFVNITAGVAHVDFGGKSLAGATFGCIDGWLFGSSSSAPDVAPCAGRKETRGSYRARLADERLRGPL